MGLNGFCSADSSECPTFKSILQLDSQPATLNSPLARSPRGFTLLENTLPIPIYTATGMSPESQNEVAFFGCGNFGLTNYRSATVLIYSSLPTLFTGSTS